MMREKMITMQQKIGVKTVIGMMLGFAMISAYAESCDQCNQLHTQISKEEAARNSYLTLKQKNEDYLKRPNVDSGAMIKVQSNLLLINIKIETANNKIEAFNIEKKKLNDCVGCAVPEAQKS
jgi:hypothetical protein